jgi:hypothetical protein
MNPVATFRIGSGVSSGMMPLQLQPSEVINGPEIEAQTPPTAHGGFGSEKFGPHLNGDANRNM